jgi:hypothetical protein
MPKKSILEPYFTEIYRLHKQGKSDQYIADFINLKYSLKIWKNQVYTFLKTREKKGIKPTKNDIINFLKKDNGTEKNIDINKYEKDKIISAERKEIKIEKPEEEVSRLDEIMKELGI